MGRCGTGLGRAVGELVGEVSCGAEELASAALLVLDYIVIRGVVAECRNVCKSALLLSFLNFEFIILVPEAEEVFALFRENVHGVADLFLEGLDRVPLVLLLDYEFDVLVDVLALLLEASDVG